MARSKKPFGATQDERMKALASVAKEFSGFRPAPEVLTAIEAVPTIFPQYDAAVRVGGHPIGRFSLLHGESSGGKTQFALGLGKSFLARGHFFALADAERTTPPDWLQTLMGGLMQSPGFVALPVRTYEQTVDGVRDFCLKVQKARDKGDLPDDTTGLILIDSIRKLVPEGLLKNLMKESSAAKGDGDSKKKPRGVDGLGGRAGQIKAALNAAWVDELIPLLADTRMAMVVIARETKDPDAGLYDEGIKVGGGSALYYDASLDLRVTQSYIRDADDKNVIYGERHRVQVRKTKLAYKDESTPFAYFHSSNGQLAGVPAGFDLARDLLELGIDTGIVERSGSWFSYDTGEQRARMGNGENATVRFLHQHPDVLAAIDEAVRDVTRKEPATP